MELLLLEFVIRSTLIAVAAAGVLWVMRVKTAAVRHAVWAGVVILMLLLPAWAAWGPRTIFRVLPWTRAELKVTTSLSRSFPAEAGMKRDASPPTAYGMTWNWDDVLAAVYLLGLGTTLTRMAIGTVRAHRLIRGAAERDGKLTNPACAAPVTVGFYHPKVIFPDNWQHWSAAQLDAVLAHENAHNAERPTEN